MPDPNRNPFIGREIIIRGDELWYGVREQVLALYGQHIWYLTVNTTEVTMWDWEQGGLFGVLTFDVYTILRNIPPNLGMRIINDEDEDDSEVSDFGPYPSLDNLETLHFDKSPERIYRSVSARYHHQLRRVHMRAVYWLSVYNLGWPALVELHLQELSTNDDHYDSLLEAQMPSLRKLGCGSKEDDCDSKDMLDEMLKIITNLSEITQLNTVRCNANILMGFSRYSIEELKSYAPPSLKTVEMELEHFYYKNDLTHYPFLLHFPFLENLNMYWGRASWDGISDSCELYKSKIWVLFTTLNLYTREGCDNFMKQKKASNLP